MKQKMWISLVISCIGIGLLGACATSKSRPKLESGWAHLEGVADPECSSWPLLDSQLDVTEMPVDVTASGGFAATVRYRNGSRAVVFAETRGSPKLDVDDMIPLPVGRDAFVLAPFNFKQQPLAFVIQNKNERAWLEVRSVKDNKLVTRMATPLQKEAESGRLVTSSSGWWLQVNHDDREASYVFVSAKENSDWEFKVMAFKTFSPYAALVGNQFQENVFVVENTSKNTEVYGQFQITLLNSKNQPHKAGKVKISTKGGLESWSVGSLGRKIIFVVVRGDSMVGQGVLTVTGVDASVETLTSNWSKEFPLNDVHLGEPVLLSNGRSVFVGLMKWVDAESVLARLKVDNDGAEMLSDLGVFQRGTILAAGYLNAENSGVGAFRFRKKDLWEYKLCKLSF
jgi:hypothetical protein